MPYSSASLPAQPLTAQPLLIFVGVTGVGKSTTIDELRAREPTLRLLPNRRALTDQLIISTLQEADGSPVTPVTDRSERFAYTRRYREQYPGGMAYALSRLTVDEDAPGLLVFDGLRGANEVRHAANLLPRACFVMLDAPDWVRVMRLMGRGDAFDQIASPRSGTAFRPEETHDLFTPEEAYRVEQMVADDPQAQTNLPAKLEIVRAERRNYDPGATRCALNEAAKDRALIIDTVQHTPAEAAQVILQALEQWKVHQP
ncbi:MAG: ATPase [Caldilineaceae bacterium]|nr:ATPase [Caldilineaceae bacterium]